ncbi:hypothetical protein N9K87_01430 [Flavobacteriaceae bacterium]|nr:hypothetical protein [Flavobacteriaceae bacterium]
MQTKIDKNKLNDFIATFLVTSYIVLCLILELKLPGNEFINQPIIILFGLLIVFFTLKHTYFKIELHRFSKISFLVLILFFFLLINSFFIREKLLFGAVFNLFMGAVIGKYLAVNKNISNIILIPFWFLVIYIISKLLINLDPNQVFIRSRNYISFFLIITVLPYYINKINFHKSFSLLPALITLILCLYSLGRSGIISSLILFFTILFFSNFKFKKIIFLGFIISFSSLFFYFLVYLVDVTELSRIVEISNYKDLGGRSTILINYLNNLTFLNFIFGMDTDTYEILNLGGSYFPGHVHSSILNFISVVGVGSFIFFKYLFNKSRFFIKQNPALFFLMISLLLRIFTETGVLFGYFDYVIWIFIFCTNVPNYKLDVK